MVSGNIISPLDHETFGERPGKILYYTLYALYSAVSNFVAETSRTKSRWRKTFPWTMKQALLYILITDSNEDCLTWKVRSKITININDRLAFRIYIGYISNIWATLSQWCELSLRTHMSMSSTPSQETEWRSRSRSGVAMRKRPSLVYTDWLRSARGIVTAHGHMGNIKQWMNAVHNDKLTLSIQTYAIVTITWIKTGPPSYRTNCNVMSSTLVVGFEIPQGALISQFGN